MRQAHASLADAASPAEERYGAQHHDDTEGDDDDDREDAVGSNLGYGSAPSNAGRYSERASTTTYGSIQDVVDDEEEDDEDDNPF